MPYLSAVARWSGFALGFVFAVGLGAGLALAGLVRWLEEG